MLENAINTPSPSTELQISSNRYQLEYTVASTLPANAWNTIGTLPNDAIASSVTFNFEKSIVQVDESNSAFFYPICEPATTVQYRVDLTNRVVQIYFTSRPTGFRICVEYSKNNN